MIEKAKQKEAEMAERDRVENNQNNNQ